VFMNHWKENVREWRMFNHLLEIWKDENGWSPMP